jgi:hypothetical protein
MKRAFKRWKVKNIKGGKTIDRPKEPVNALLFIVPDLFPFVGVLKVLNKYQELCQLLYTCPPKNGGWGGVF